jgi:hypothetical protein
MNYITRQYLKVTQCILTTQSVSLVVCIGALAIALFIISAVSSNHTVETWSSLLSGFAFGVFLVCLPALVNYLKKNKQEMVK